MIAEALHWALTPTPGWARRAGYLGELIAIRARHRRWRREWAPHLQASKDAIRIAMARCTKRRHAMVYGSGPLLDIPLAELAATFDRVTLVDAAHLWPTRLAVRRYGNVRLVERDVSGVVQGLLEGVAQGADSIPKPRPNLPTDHESVDFLVSANILSQLAVTPLRFLSQRIVLNAEGEAAFMQGIAQAHLDHLNKFNGVRCLIVDSRHEYADTDGAVQKIDERLPGIVLPPHDSSWWWDVAPLGEISPDFSVRANMLAITLPAAGGGL